MSPGEVFIQKVNIQSCGFYYGFLIQTGYHAVFYSTPPIAFPVRPLNPTTVLIFCFFVQDSSELLMTPLSLLPYTQRLRLDTHSTPT